MTFSLSRGKNQWAVKVSALSGKSFWSLAIDNKKSKMIDLYSAYMEKNYRHLFNRSRVSGAMTMNWGIHQSIVFGLHMPLSKKVVQA